MAFDQSVQAVGLTPEMVQLMGLYPQPVQLSLSVEYFPIEPQRRQVMVS